MLDLGVVSGTVGGDVRGATEVDLRFLVELVLEERILVDGACGVVGW